MAPSIRRFFTTRSPLDQSMKLFYGADNWTFDLHVRGIEYKVSGSNQHDTAHCCGHQCPKDETKKAFIVFVGHFSLLLHGGPPPPSLLILVNNILLWIRFLDGAMLRCGRVLPPVRLTGTKWTALVFFHAMSIHTQEVTTRMTPQAFAMFGNGHIGYVRPVRSENMARFFPELNLAPGLELFTLHAADGTPLMVAATRLAAVASAREYLLDPVSVH
jgi:hypothetical protein